jgi:hypothetical protein
MRADGRRILVGALLVGLSGLASLTACQSEPSQDGVANTDRFLSQINVGEFDYDPFSSPDEMAKAATLIVRGKVLDLVAGRAFREPKSELADITTGVFQIEVTEVLGGRLAEGSDGMVYIEEFGVQEPEQVAANMPKVADVLLYLVPAPDAPPIPGAEIIDDGAGVAPGQHLYQQVNPQGFYMDIGSDVAQVVGGEVYKDSSLSQFEPGNDSFPGTPVRTE